MVGEMCIKHDQLIQAAKAFEIGGAMDRLNQVGDIFMQKEQLNNAYEVYKIANNSVMIEFLRENFKMM